MSRWFTVTALVFTAALAGAQTLVVDASTDEGPLRYGATGFLYGLGDEGIPDRPILSALRPQVIAQKAPDGLQHPNGDALKTAPAFLAAGGRQVQIYLQDIYQQWPYEQPGMSDYVPKVEAMVRKVLKDPNRAAFAYIPLNEPDVIWYNGNEKALFQDWKLLYRKIKALDPAAPICGPNTTSYDSQSMKRFLTWAVQNQCVPDVLTWHELQNDFFTQWDRHLDSARSIQSDLGIGPLPIVINEYGRFSGDLGVPGHLLQYVARFERDGVDGCLAYWTTAGSLNDLVTANNRPTGGWWLYRWYAGLTGHRVAVTPPSRNIEGLQGLATFDKTKAQLRILAGGTDDDCTVEIRHLEAPFPGQSDFTVTLWQADSTGLKASGSPPRKTLHLTTSEGTLTVPLGWTKSESAYLVMVTPATPNAESPAGRLEAEDQDLVGSARVAAEGTGWTGTGYVALDSGAGVRFVTNVPADGYYRLNLNERAVETTWTVRADSRPLPPWTGPEAPGWTSDSRILFLTAGVHVLEFNASGRADVDGLDLFPAEGPRRDFPAPKVKAGNPVLVPDATATGPSPHWLVLTYANGELGAGASNYNANIVDRWADVVAGGTVVPTTFRNTLGWRNWSTKAVLIPPGVPVQGVELRRHGTGAVPVVSQVSLVSADWVEP